MRSIKKSAAANVMMLMVDDGDHVTGVEELTLLITASKNGGAFNEISPEVTDRGDGWYNLALTSSHTDTLGDLVIHCEALPPKTADPADRKVDVVAYDPATAWATGGAAMALTEGTLNAIKALDQTIEGTLTQAEILKLLLAKIVGKTSGAGTASIVFKSQDGTKNRISYTVDPTTGERTDILLDTT